MNKKKLNELMYRLKIRKALKDNPSDYLIITYDELIKELNRRKLKYK